MKSRRLTDISFDVLLVAGLAAIVYGVSSFSPAAGFIVGGFFLAACSVLASAGRRGRRLDPEGKEE